MTLPEELTKLHKKLDLHYPKTYLNAWAQGVRPDWAQFLEKVFSIVVPKFLDSSKNRVVLDLGSGPSICNIIAASKWASSIYLAELLEGNRKEITKYLEGAEDAWNWEPYFEFQVNLDYNLNPEKSLLSNKIIRS